MICLMTECRTRHAAPGELQIKVAARGNRVSMALADTEGWPRRQDSRAGYLARALCLSFPLVLWWTLEHSLSMFPVLCVFLGVPAKLDQ